MDSQNGNNVFAGGGGGGGWGGHNVPLVFGAQKKPGWDRVKGAASRYSVSFAFFFFVRATARASVADIRQ